MIKGFIEVHNAKCENNATLINVSHITDVADNVIYMDDILPCAADYPHIVCVEPYEEIKQKIKEAVGDAE